MADVLPCQEQAIILVVDGHSLVCDKDVLQKASPYFEAMFNSNMKESTAECVNLQGASYEAMELLVHFSQTGEISVSWDNVHSLLECASMYQFSKVSDKCVSFLLRNLDVTNCLRSMHLADRLSLNDLYNKARRWSVWFFTEIIQQEEFMQMDTGALVNYLSCGFLQTTSESNVLCCLLNWINYDKDERLDQLPFLLDVVRFEQISSDDIEKITETCPLVSTRPDIQKSIKDYHKRAAAANSLKRPRCIPMRLGIVGGNCTSFEGGNIQPHPCVHYLDHGQHQLEKCCSLANVFSNVKQINGCKACVIGKELYLTGGEAKLGHNQWFYDVWKYDCISEQWDLVTQLRQPRRHHSLCVWDKSFYLIGGFGRHRLVLDSVEKYNTETGQWIKCASLLTPQFSAAAAVCNEKLYVIKHDIQCYEPTLDYWMHIKIPLPFENGLHCAMTRGKAIYLTGLYILDLLEFDTEAKKVRKLGKFKKAAGSACIVVNTLYVVAGEECNVIESYNFESEEFKEVLQLDSCFNNHSSVALPVFPHFSVGLAK